MYKDACSIYSLLYYLFSDGYYLVAKLAAVDCNDFQLRCTPQKCVISVRYVSAKNHCLNAIFCAVIRDIKMQHPVLRD